MKGETRADKLFQDHKSRFHKFVLKNNELKTLERDFIEGDLGELYVFFQSGLDPKWDERMKKLL